MRSISCILISHTMFCIGKSIKGKFENELLAISQQLTSEETKSTMTYKDYMELKQKEETIQREIYRLSIEHEIWDEAREICMDIADEEVNK